MLPYLFYWGEPPTVYEVWDRQYQDPTFTVTPTPINWLKVQKKAREGGVFLQKGVVQYRGSQESDRRENEMEQASKRQTWAIKCACGLDVRHMGLVYDEAKNILDALNDDEYRALQIQNLVDRGAKGTPKEDAKSKARKYQAAWDKAVAAGRQAAEDCSPTPMIVQEHANPLDDNSPVVRQYAPVMGGVCGFAGLRVRPGNSSFARWLVKHQDAHKSYYGGVETSIFDYNQSMERKSAHASAMAKVLKAELPEGSFKGLYSWNRMD